MSIGFHGVDDTNSNAAAEARIEAFATENHSGTAAGTRLRFYTKPNGTGPGSNPTNWMTLEQSGQLTLSNSNSTNSIVCATGTFGTVWKKDAQAASGDVVGRIGVYYDSSTENSTIRFHRGGSTTGGFMSFTSHNGAERMRITGGYVKAANDASYINSTGGSHEFNQSGNAESLSVRATNSSFSSTVNSLFAVRSATSSYWFIRGVSSSGGAGADNEFYIRGDGRAFADESWNGGGADYAEYFEWSDGNTEAEDRRGISVVLDGDKIREAVAGEEPIGVISGHPSVVGDADMDRWKGKYLRDDYGSYVLNEDGYRQLNPDFDSSAEYIQREDRPEWDTVGLMGKLRIRKGQVTGTRWIKMRDVSDTVEEWLVR